MGNDWRMHPLLSLQIYLTERKGKQGGEAGTCGGCGGVFEVLARRWEGERNRESQCAAMSFISS